MNIVSKLTLDALTEIGEKNLIKYSENLVAACESSPPPFGFAWYGEKYRKLACKPDWFAYSLINNALKESEGSQKLWELSGQTNDPNISEQIRLHAIDESRHAHLYVKIFDLVFPHAIEFSLRSEVNNSLPNYSRTDLPARLSSVSETYVLDSLIQMNIGEIRTRINQLLMSPIILAYCSEERREQLRKLVDSLLVDETRHIGYTAQLIEQAISSGYGEFVCNIMHKRLAEFNKMTVEEVGGDRFEGT